MITSGLVITLSTDAALAAQAVASVGARLEFTADECQDRWLPVAMEARDDAESRDLHDWLQALPGVEYVDVVSVNFEEPESGCVEDQPQQTMSCGTLRLVEDDTAALRPTSEVNHEH